ncbi:hypothetical protein DUNSADRAFT_9494 [Dunaliella salina]|uniref:Encoded protein n=1 Tax=Dunaliella salina TaxID=3046 RepID=A0ABQ7GHC1_DUNSA|nr:hypothetical protein DUNSADRAFT_9494 [Dunaliella salina]|eukprot:KAF5834010.1 hypothetical protein DUNSADRAFT_9494 [Dunaliella salina]
MPPGFSFWPKLKILKIGCFAFVTRILTCPSEKTFPVVDIYPTPLVITSVVHVSFTPCFHRNPRDAQYQ